MSRVRLALAYLTRSQGLRARGGSVIQPRGALPASRDANVDRHDARNPTRVAPTQCLGLFEPVHPEARISDDDGPVPAAKDPLELLEEHRL